ncbi:MAG: hypothetical protein CME65_10200 [Halobacteriovoraceae bacterium]|nr:hypothetical protein [Halobacteriovoraceae bacterium]|tara:strand:+ start:5551 stop:6450 length:900 start_codon:yes stop_codon:yes gene_type:complete
MRKVLRLTKEFINECQEKNLILLAASSSFFFFLCLIPLTLLMLNFAGFLFESITPKQTIGFLNYIDSVIPEDIMPTFKKLFNHSSQMMKSQRKLNTIHYLVLALSSIGFFTSIWRSVDIITSKKQHGTILTTFKGFVTIAFSFAFILLLSAIPLLTKFIDFLMELKWVKSIKLHEFLAENFEQLGFSSINIVSTLLLFMFFIFFFKFLLRGEATMKSTVVGSGFFTTSVLMAKIFFFHYLVLIKDNLINNYGQLYSVMIFILWVYSLILLFYMGIIFTYVLSQQRFKILEETPPDFIAR